MSSYYAYRGQTLGRLLHFLHEYCSYHVAEHCTISGDQVLYQGELVADIEWKYGDLPVFRFSSRYPAAAAAQRRKMLWAVSDCWLVPNCNKPKDLPDSVEFLGIVEGRKPFSFADKIKFDVWYDTESMKVTVVNDDVVRTMSFFVGARDDIMDIEQEALNRVRQHMFARSFVAGHSDLDEGC